MRKPDEEIESLLRERAPDEGDAPPLRHVSRRDSIWGETCSVLDDAHAADMLCRQWQGAHRYFNGARHSDDMRAPAEELRKPRILNRDRGRLKV
jgi:hypothetical protein